MTSKQFLQDFTKDIVGDAAHRMENIEGYARILELMLNGARLEETNGWALEIIKCKNPLALPQYIYDYHQKRIAELKEQS